MIRPGGQGRAALFCLLLALGACGGGGGGSAPPPVQPPVVPPPVPPAPDPGATGFEAGEISPDGSGTFVLGVSPETVTFSGGRAGGGGPVRSGSQAWHVAPGATGLISFETPAESVTLHFMQELPVTRNGQACGIADLGFDNTEAFGGTIYARGGFNDWANNPAPAPPYLFVNTGNGVYEAEFEMAAGTFEFKIADADWTRVEYGDSTQVFVPGIEYTVAGVVPDGGPNSVLTVEEAGCYRWTLEIVDASSIPAPLANLTVSASERTGGQLRVFDGDDIQLMAVSGSNVFSEVSLARGPEESGISRIEVENSGGDVANTALVSVDDFVFTPVTDVTPPPGEQKTAEALLSGFNLDAAVDSFGSGLGEFTLDDNTGALAGSVRLAGIEATAVVLRLDGALLVTLRRDAADPSVWVVPDGTVLSAAALQAYLDGTLELVVSTSAFPAGEIGGTLVPEGVVALPDNGDVADRSPRDEIIYFVMTDRFFNGDPSNDDGNPPGPSSGGFNAFNTATWHGGDFAGLVQKLDYLQGLGITAIWVTPPVANSGDNAYHGYWALDFENIDPHFGGNDAYRAFIDEAHARGIKVYQDVVVNHTADVITYAEGQFTYRPLSEPPYTPVVPAELADAKNPAWLNDPQYYHNRGNSTFSGESSIYGDFIGLDDIATELPFVREQFIEIFSNWIAFGVDGFRLDTAKHVRTDFWTEFAPAVLDFSASIGKDYVTMFGEVFDGNAVAVSEFVTAGELPAMINFPLHFSLPGAFSNTASLDGLFAEDDRFADADTDARDLVNFFGNHDIGRAAGILRDTLPGLDDDGQVDALSLAHAMNFFLRGTPVIYYGDEQGFPGDGGDQGAREDMLASQVPSYNDNDLVGTDATTADENFDVNHPIYRNLSRYAEVYKQHAPLRRGVQLPRYSENEAGLYAVSRIEPEVREEYLVIFNTGAGNDSATISTGTPDATFYAVWPPASPPVSSNGSGAVFVTLPGFDFAIYRADRPMPEPAPVTALNITAPINGSAAEGIVEVTTDLLAGDLVRLHFETSVDGGPFEPAGDDYDSPYRLFWFADKVSGPAVVTLRASVTNPDGSVISDEVDLLVDNRQIGDITVYYENGNNRGELVLIDEGGEVIGPTAITGQEAMQFSGAIVDGAITVVYQDRDGDSFAFDRPVFVDSATQLALAADNGSDLSLVLYINNDHALSDVPNFTGSGSPPVLPVDPAAPAPFGGTVLYVRGTFNDWGLDHPLTYAGNYTYAGPIEGISGELGYKIADADWTTTTDFGAPYSESGLNIGGGVPNLVDSVTTGDYDFYFFSIPDSGGALNFHQLVKRPDPNADNPYGVAVFVRGSFNGWGLTDPMTYDMAGDTFSATVNLASDTHAFKIASEDWATADFGGDGVNNSVTLDTPKLLESTSFNLELAVPTAGTYVFSLDATEPAAPVLTVSPAP